MLTIRRTDRNFAIAEFTDRSGSQCSIQESSLATEAAIWLGVQKDFQGRAATRMHLTEEMVADLLPLLHNFVASGELMPPIEALRRDGGWISVGEMMPPAHGDDVANLDLLLAQLSDVADGARSAHFACAAVLALPDGTAHVVEGRIDGTLVHQPRGSNGFGYDPVFQPYGQRRTTAEMSAAEKDAISHRGRAFRALVPRIRALLG